jgi:anthranilate synthase/aminodeoxychorismate synthase-like glutamine amidotransferase
MILLIDNYDSFVHNLARHFARLGQETRVVRNDAIDAAAARKLNPAAIVFSPGPCTPPMAGASLELVKRLLGEFAMLGVCLGHQIIAEALGGQVARAPEPWHGRTSRVNHDGAGLFADLPTPLDVCRYHSLVVNAALLPEQLRSTAHTDDGILMAFEHTRLPVFGVQFHPEAILTAGGYQLLANFLRLAGIAVNVDIDELAVSELTANVPNPPTLPTGPVTF